MAGVEESILMAEALEMARTADSVGDHPFGAVLVTNIGTVKERNRVVTARDPTAHSEVMAIRAAAKQWGNDAIIGSLLVTSFEPCPMCLGAIMEAGVSTLLIGARPSAIEKPGNYTVEALLDLLDREDDIMVRHGPQESETAAFYSESGWFRAKHGRAR